MSKRKQLGSEGLVPIADLYDVVAAFLWPREIANLMLVDRNFDKRILSRRVLEQLHVALSKHKTPLPKPWPTDVYLTGSTVFWALFGDHSWTPDDVDLFVPNHPPTIQAAQRWLVTAGYRISKVQYVHPYTTEPVGIDMYHSFLGVISWEHQPHSPNEQFLRDDGGWKYAMKNLDALCEEMWLPERDDSDCSGSKVQLIVSLVNAHPERWSHTKFLGELLRFDIPALENVYDGTSVTVLFPDDVRTGHSEHRPEPRKEEHFPFFRRTKSIPELAFERRRDHREFKYTQRGLTLHH